MDSDEALYAKLIGGDLAAFDRLYERYERPLLGFVLVQIGDRAEAEDVCHEAFIAVLRARDQLRFASRSCAAQQAGPCHELRSFRAWLYRVARNLCLNRLRSRRRAASAIETIANTATAPDAVPRDPEMLAGAVARLPAPLAEVYALRSRGLSYEELASVLDVPLGTVKSRMHEMVKRLRAEMEVIE